MGKRCSLLSTAQRKKSSRSGKPGEHAEIDLDVMGLHLSSRHYIPGRTFILVPALIQKHRDISEQSQSQF